jgi:hypothetical protein
VDPANGSWQKTLPTPPHRSVISRIRQTSVDLYTVEATDDQGGAFTTRRRFACPRYAASRFTAASQDVCCTPEPRPKGWIQRTAVQGVAMKHPRCIIGRHEWHTRLNREGEPYEICSRPGCEKIRKTGSPFDVGGENPGPWHYPSGGL